MLVFLDAFLEEFLELVEFLVVLLVRFLLLEALLVFVALEELLDVLLAFVELEEFFVIIKYLFSVLLHQMPSARKKEADLVRSCLQKMNSSSNSMTIYCKTIPA